jgi:hypothetical protein
MCERISPMFIVSSLAWKKPDGVCHPVQIDVAQGLYYFDCVGMTDYMMNAVPNARRSLRAAAGISPGFYPSPETHIRTFAKGPIPNWVTKTTISAIRPGVRTGPFSFLSF